ncbi:type IV pilus modification protein PilV, partial [Massilia cavernae]
MLVAALVLAIGVMGAVAAQTVALRTRAQSALMSRGVQLATSFADRMRANTVQMRAPDSSNPYLQVRYDSAAAPGVSEQPPRMCRTGSACDSAQLAGFDVYELQRELRASFPKGRA